MATIHDCALLAEHVYVRADTCPPLGWTRRDGVSWTRGFAGGCYTRGTDSIIAFRGTETDDSADIAADVMMVPMTQPGAARRAVEALFEQYDTEHRSVLSAFAPQLIDRVLQVAAVRTRVQAYANSVPTQQVTEALRYFDQCTPKPSVVVGHSLGGALAQVVAQQRSVAAVAFNSPHMGDVRGMVPATFGRIVQINAAGDPLSIATRSIGNLPHGHVVTIATRPPAIDPPQIQRAPLGWTTLVAPVPSLLKREFDARVQHQKAVIGYLGKIALYYHSMTPLRLTIAGQSRFGVPLSPTATSVGGALIGI